MVRILTRIFYFAGSMLIASLCFAQAFNIDVDFQFGPSAGPPSHQFGGAADQAGQWDAIQLGGIPQQLADIHAKLTGVSVTMHHYPQDYGDSGSFNFEGNTGDYAKLLNDAEQVAPVLDGGGMVVTFSGLKPGSYELYTYAVNVIGDYVETPVYVPGSIGMQTQVVTGPMPGNSFEYLITHSIHLTHFESGQDLMVEFYQPPNTDVQWVNGFQIVPVPEPSALMIVVFGCAFAVMWRKRVQVR